MLIQELYACLRTQRRQILGKAMRITRFIGVGIGCSDNLILDAGKGRLDKELIRRVIRQHIMEVRTCYERELSKNPKLGGRVLIHFIIGTGGEVTKSEVESSTLGNTVVEECIAAAVRSWSFPKPQGGVVSVTYPFVLQTDPDQGQSTPPKAPRPVLPPT